MFPTPELHITRDTIRFEVPGLGVLHEEPAAIVVTYRARRGAMVLAVGDTAAEIERRGFDPLDLTKVVDPDERFTRLAHAKDAPWWREDASADFDPWAHNGECAVVWPFRPETYAPALGEALIRYFEFMARRHPAARLRAASPALRAWVRLRRSVCHLAEPPPTLDAHLALADVVRLAQPPANQPPPRPLAELTWRQWADFALSFPLAPILLYFGLTTTRLAPAVGLSISAAFFAWMVHAALADVRRRRAREPHSRESLAREAAVRARFAVLPPGDVASDYTGQASFRLQPSKVVEGISTVLLIAPPLALILAQSFRLLRTHLPWGPVLFVALLAALLPARYLLAARVDLGMRGLLVRPLGLFGRPLFLPYPALRSAVTDVQHLRLVLAGGDALRLPATPLFNQPRPSRAALAAEEAILGRLGPPRPYRPKVG